MRRSFFIAGAVFFTFAMLTCALGQENVTKDKTPPVTPGAPSKEEETFINNYIDNLLYMVYIDEKIKIAPGEESLYRKAVGAANDYLASKNMETVLLDQVEKLKKDQALLSEELQGENLSVVQWLAQKLNADVYIVIDLIVKSEKRGNQYFAQSTITLTTFEAATGRLLGSKSYNQLDKSVGGSEELAKLNSVQICVSRIMDEVIKISKTYMKKAVEKGIRYELFLEGTQDAQKVLAFIEKLKASSDVVKNIESVYRTDTEGKYYVFFFGKPEDFESYIYATAKNISGFQGMNLVSQRGKSFTFSTGM
jgi:hypothetical protein